MIEKNPNFQWNRKSMCVWDAQVHGCVYLCMCVFKVRWIGWRWAWIINTHRKLMQYKCVKAQSDNNYANEFIFFGYKMNKKSGKKQWQNWAASCVLGRSHNPKRKKHKNWLSMISLCTSMISKILTYGISFSFFKYLCKQRKEEKYQQNTWTTIYEC